MEKSLRAAFVPTRSERRRLALVRVGAAIAIAAVAFILYLGTREAIGTLAGTTPTAALQSACHDYRARALAENFASDEERETLRETCRDALDATIGLGGTVPKS